MKVNLEFPLTFLVVLALFLFAGNTVWAADTLTFSPEEGVSYDAQADTYHIATDGADRYTISGTTSAVIVIDGKYDYAIGGTVKRNIALVLKGLTIDNHNEYGSGITSESAGDMLISLEGENSIRTGFRGIYSPGPLTISGTGSLKSEAYNSVARCGIHALDTITINGGDITSSGAIDGIFTMGSLYMNGGRVTAIAEESTIDDGGSIVAWGNIEYPSNYNALGVDKAGAYTVNAQVKKDNVSEIVDGLGSKVFAVRIAKHIVKGDLNGTGTVDITDARKTKRAVMRTYDLTEDELAAADLNDDGKVTIIEARKIKRVAMKEIVMDE